MIAVGRWQWRGLQEKWQPENEQQAREGSPDTLVLSLPADWAKVLVWNPCPSKKHLQLEGFRVTTGIYLSSLGLGF